MTAKRKPAQASRDVALAAGLRDLSDPRDIRALAHPTRLALLEVLTLHGPLTASQAGELIDESPSSCSFHLRTLARHGFVEETGEGRGRQRPWRRASLGNVMSEPFDDPQTRIAARALSDMFLEHYLVRLREARANFDQLEPEWKEQQVDAEAMLWVTLEELAEINQQLTEIALRYRDRVADPARRPAGARPFDLLYFTYSTELTARGSRPPDQSIEPPS
jgi:DNA-binding transcriptional ArsR family regulator